MLARFEGFNNSDLSLLTYLLDFPKRDIVKIRRAVLRSASQPELRKLVLVVAWLDNLFCQVLLLGLDALLILCSGGLHHW